MPGDRAAPAAMLRSSSFGRAQTVQAAKYAACVVAARGVLALTARAACLLLPPDAQSRLRDAAIELRPRRVPDSHRRRAVDRGRGFQAQLSVRPDCCCRLRHRRARHTWDGRPTLHQAHCCLPCQQCWQIQDSFSASVHLSAQLMVWSKGVNYGRRGGSFEAEHEHLSL